MFTIIAHKAEQQITYEDTAITLEVADTMAKSMSRYQSIDWVDVKSGDFLIATYKNGIEQ